MKSTFAAHAALLALVALSAPRAAQEFRPQFKITLDTPQVAGHTMSLGATVALEGDTLLVGAPSEDVGFSQAGAVHVYRRSAGLWEHQARLVCPNSGAKLFGNALAYSSDTLLVASNDAWGGSSVYAFRRTGADWIVETEWLRPGRNLALDGDLALIGDPGQTAGGYFEGGLVRVCSRSGSTWTTTILISANPLYRGQFGWSVALQGTNAAIGEVAYDAQGNRAGIVHVYDLTGGAWVETATLVSGRIGDEFGYRVVFDGDTLAIGAPYTEVGGYWQAGAVHVFVRAGSTWIPQAVLVAGDPDTGDWLGRDLGLHGDTVLAASEYDDNANGVVAGAGRVFERQGSVWNETALLVSMEPRDHLQLGRCAALSADTAVLGAPRGDIGGHPSGAVYVFARVPPPALSIDAVTPDPIEALYPGTDRTVSIRGTGLDLATSLYLDGTRVSAARHQLVAPDEIRLDMPQLPNVGYFSLGLHDGAAMDFHTIVLAAPPTPRLEIGTGELLEPVVFHDDFTPVIARLAGPVGSVHYLFGSLSSLPSSNHYVTLGLGNQFSELALLGRFVIPARGWKELEFYSHQFPDPGGGSLDVYAQMLQFAAPSPFRVSNLQSILVLP